MVTPRTIRTATLGALLSFAVPSCDFEARGADDEEYPAEDDPAALAPAPATTEVTTPEKAKKPKRKGGPPAKSTPDAGTVDARAR